MKPFIVILCSALLILSSLQVISSAEATTAASEETSILSATTSASLSAVNTAIAQDATTIPPVATTLVNSETTAPAIATTKAVFAAEPTVLAEGTTVAKEATAAAAGAATTAATVAETAATVAETAAAVAEVTTVVAETTVAEAVATTLPAVFVVDVETIVATEIEATVATTVAAETTGAAETTTLSAAEDDATTIAAATTAAAVEAVTTEAAKAGETSTTVATDGNAAPATTTVAGITPAPVGVTTLAGEAVASTTLPAVESGAGATVATTTVAAVESGGGVITTATTPQATTKPADPCTPGGYQLISETNRHFSSKTAPSCDRSLQEGWYRFMIDGKNAKITDKCIKEGACGSRYPMRIDLGGNAMPREGSELKVGACTVGEGPFGSIECCLARVNVIIKGCNGFHVYKLQPTPHCEATYCVQDVDEELPRSYQAIPPPPVNRALQELSSEERENAVTFEVDMTGKPFDQDQFAKYFKEVLIGVLNNPDPPATTVAATAAAATKVPATSAAGETVTTTAAEPVATTTAAAAAVPVVATTVATAVSTKAAAAVKRRRKRLVKYGTDSVVFVAPTPHVLPDGKVEVVFFVKSSVNGKPVVISKEDLLKLQKQIKRDIREKMGVNVVKVSVGIPPYILDAEASESRDRESNIFIDHLGLFITMIVVACVCIIVIIVGLIVMKKCRNNEYYVRSSVHDKDTLKMEEGKKHAMESPLTDEEIMKDEKPMLESTPSINGHGKNMNKPDDDGWVVPYEELTKDQRDQPEVEDTKL